MLVNTAVPLAAEIDELGSRPRRGAPERQAQCAVIDYLRTVLPAGSVVAAVKNEHQPRSKTVAGRKRFFAKRREEGVVAGFPDVVACLPGPRVVFVEMKAPASGVLTAKQIECHARLQAIGFQVVVCRSIDDADAAFRAIGVPLSACPQVTTPPEFRRLHRG